jgi:hypothetical protein
MTIIIQCKCRVARELNPAPFDPYIWVLQLWRAINGVLSLRQCSSIYATLTSLAYQLFHTAQYTNTCIPIASEWLWFKFQPKTWQKTQPVCLSSGTRNLQVLHKKHNSTCLKKVPHTKLIERDAKYTFGSRESTVVTVTKLRAGLLRNRGSNPGSNKTFIASLKHPEQFWGPP